MMAAPMDNSVAPSSWELAERLYNKNIELESNLRKYAKSRVPSNPNTWFQIRENYEAIILKDHEFSEKRDIELALWQLHYRRIEEFRTLLNAVKSSGSVSTEGGRTLPKPESVKKIRSGLKTFLSESTGFYHDLILKIKAKFGLPLGLFSDGPESQTTAVKDEKKSADMKRGLISCHRSLIYLGDLARYKGSYGEGDSINREFAAASSYYTQAASLYPSSGNPHHQLAILASYSGDELVSVYCYFRSLAADIPFSTARDNLIISFEKNRQTFSLLPSNHGGLTAKPLNSRTNGRGRGRADARPPTKGTKPESVSVKERELSNSELLKSFVTRFVRVNGILFTRTSLETFGEVFSSAKSDLAALLSCGCEDELKFGPDGSENGLLMVRLIAVLIFTVHNVKKESDGQSYAEILQRTVLLENAYTAAFELTGNIIERCKQLQDVASSFLLPGIVVFTEWLACHQDIAVGPSSDAEGAVRSFFWNQLVSLMNSLTSSGILTVNKDEDETFLLDSSRYNEEDTGNRLALWEDFELRGFVPLVPAHSILDFSRKHSVRGEKDKQARVQRLFAAVRALTNVVRVDQKALYFDGHVKKFVMGVEPEICYGSGSESKSIPVTVEAKAHQIYGDDDDDEEEIVFKPAVGERHPATEDAFSVCAEEMVQQQIPCSSSSIRQGVSAANQSLEPLQNVNLNTSKWLMEQASVLSNALKNSHREVPGQLGNMKWSMDPNGNGYLGGSPSSVAYPPIVSRMACTNAGLKAPMKPLSRHLGPPPGFPCKQIEEPMMMANGNTSAMDDYRWLDEYQPLPAAENNVAFTRAMDFPFPNDKWKDFQPFERLRITSEQHKPATLPHQTLWPPGYHV